MDSAKFSRRRHPGTTELFSIAQLVLWLAFAAAAGAQEVPDPSSGANARNGTAALDIFLRDVQTLTAEFDQQTWSADDRLLEEAEGHFALKRPKRFLWSYERPIEQSVIADGKDLWMYDVELAQATRAALDESADASAAMLLSGSTDVSESFDVVETFARDGLEWVRLQPKLEGADIRSVLIGLDGRSPARLEIIDGLEQVTRIEFSDIVINPELSDSVFEFEPPPGVDVIGDGG
jgi:outer membrane lipoprotein carrier protein